MTPSLVSPSRAVLCIPDDGVFLGGNIYLGDTLAEAFLSFLQWNGFLCRLLADHWRQMPNVRLTWPGRKDHIVTVDCSCRSFGTQSLLVTS